MNSLTTSILGSFLITLCCIAFYLFIAFGVFEHRGSKNDLFLAATTSASRQGNREPGGTGNSAPLVITSSGKIEGVYVERLGKNINAFYGIPYATPPINSLRFARPE